MALNKRHIWTLLLCIYVTAVAVLCFMKPEGLPEVRPDLWGLPIDKIAHFMMFFPFPILSYGAFMPKRGNKIVHIALVSALYGVGLSFAIGTEHIQGVLGYRSEDIHDFYADLIGISCSAVLTSVYVMIKKS